MDSTSIKYKFTITCESSVRAGMCEETSWTDFERLVLMRSSREMMPEIAEALGLPMGDVTGNFEEVNAILEKQFESRAKLYREWGFERRRLS